MQLPVLTIRDAVERQLCAGCGACAALAPGALAMVDVAGHGQRPMALHTWDDVPGGLSALCPGVAMERPELTHDDATPSLQDAWGPVIDVFEGYASDAAVRHGGSSGGAATAIAQFALEHLDYHGVLHTAASTEEPWRNTTVMSRDAHALHERTGSRYAPASPCDGLQQIADAPRPCVFIGKPCDVAGAVMAARVRPALAEINRRLPCQVAFRTQSRCATQDRAWPAHLLPQFVGQAAFRTEQRSRKTKMRQQMQRLVQQIKRLVPGQHGAAPEMRLNRVAQGQSHDRALAAFKDGQIQVARRARQTAVAQDSARV